MHRSSLRGAVIKLLSVAALVGLVCAILGYQWYYGRRVHLTDEWQPLLVASAESHGQPLTHALRPLPSDAILFRVQGDHAGDYFGWSVARLGDVNGDGTGDFAVGAHQLQNRSERPDFTLPTGYVRVFSGADGSALYTLKPEGSLHIDSSDDMFGIAVTGLDDLDGDGAADLAVGSFLYDFEDADTDEVDENTGAVLVFSGATGERLELLGGERWGDRFGFALDVVPDLDGDGKRDLLVGVEKGETSESVKNAGRAEIWSTGTFERLVAANGPGWEGRMGHSVAALGDVNGDGVADFASGAYMFGARQAERIQRGAVGVFSGADGALLRAFEGAADLDNLGASVASLDGADGAHLIALGATQSGYEAEYTGRYEGAGWVRLFDSETGAQVAELSGATLGDQFGWALENVGDLNADGVDELLVGAPSSMTFLEDKLDRPGRVYLVSGADQRVHVGYAGASLNDQFGAALALLDDLDGDGIAEVLIGAPQNTAGQSEPGYAVVVSGRALWPAH